MILRFGDVVLSRLPFHQSDGSKIRPAVVVLDVGDDDFVMAPVTSRIRQSDYAFLIHDWLAAGLTMASCIRIDKTTLLSKNAIIRKLGQLELQDRDAFASIVCKVFCQRAPSP